MSENFIMFSSNLADYPGYKKSTTGTYYKIHTSDNKDTTGIRVGSIISMDLIYRTVDSILYDSKITSDKVTISIIEPQYPNDFYEAMKLFHQGDIATFILNAGPFFTKTLGQPELPAYLTEETDLYFSVDISKVQIYEQAESEQQAINEKLREEELIRLKKYIVQKNISTLPSSTGVYYLETNKGTGKSPAQGEYASAHYTVYLLGNSNNLFSTRSKDEPPDFKCGSQFENKGFQEVIGMMKEGGEADAIVPSSMAFGEKGAGDIVPPFSTLYYEVELVDVMTSAEWDLKQADMTAKKPAAKVQQDNDEIVIVQKYLNDNNIVPTIVLPNSHIYIEKRAGKGGSPIEGQKVKVQYTVKLLDGIVFDSSLGRGIPFEFFIGRKQVIEGWEDGILLMKAGGIGTLIIPSKLAYKDRGAGKLIPPFATLIFDVELLDVEQ